MLRLALLIQITATAEAHVGPKVGQHRVTRSFAQQTLSMIAEEPATARKPLRRAAELMHMLDQSEESEEAVLAAKLHCSRREFNAFLQWVAVSSSALCV